MIALVDDDRNILTSVSIALEGEGYRVIPIRMAPPRLTVSEQPSGSRDPRYQDAANGRHGDVAAAAAKIGFAGDLPHLQG